MSQYSYFTDPLDSDSIRLLGLMPDEDLTSPIHCRLHDYSLRESDRGIHLYEALSYVWGSLENPKVVYIDNRSLSITANLHRALLHLRDPTFERIIWVDSICINQEDDTEKSHQIQLMAKIFGQANRVIVYLGDEADDSNQALESIRIAAEDDSPTLITNEVNQAGIFELLKRPWFQRIWILQEVGFAQQILIMCGSATIDGYTFSIGFSKLFYNHQSDLPNLIRPVIYLIRGAIFRPKHAIRSSGALSLGALVDMYHTRKATKRHDKVYALLNMSSDSYDLAGLLPDYKVTWVTLLERLVKFTISQDISIKTWEGKEIALIESKGYVLGHVHSINIDSTRHERQCVNIKFNNQPSINNEKYHTRWILQASAKSIQQGDLVCLLKGAPKPTIIRAYKDYFVIIVIAVALQNKMQKKGGCFESTHPLPSMKNFSRDFLLIWDWEQSPENLQCQAEYEGTIESYYSVPEYLKTDKNRVANSINVVLALADARNYENEEDVLERQIKHYEGMLGGEDLHVLALKESLAWIYYQKDDRMKAKESFLQLIQARNVLQGKYHQDTLRSVAKLGLVYMEGINCDLNERDVTRISNRIESNIQMSEEDMIQLGRLSNHEMMELLLEQKKDNVKVTEEVVTAVARNWIDGYQILKLLFEKRDEEITITEKVLTAAVGNWDHGYRILELLFEKRDEEITITEKVLTATAGNPDNGYQIMKLLFEKRGEEIKITEAMVKTATRISAARKSDNGYQILRLLFEKRSEEMSFIQEILEIAAEIRYYGKEIIMLLLEKQREKVVITEEVVGATGRSYGNGKEIMMLLLEERGEATVPEKAVMLIARHFQVKFMALLLEKQSEKLIITEEILKAAVGNYHYGQEITMLLLEKRGNEVIITEEVLEVAERRSHLKDEVMELLLKHRQLMS
ncbi:putative het domain protein [Botrytis fragariae]|uniref:Putative het domain protein n=1 Tax=Botrytis fragariae TaxID=1964551 RepID=A0A8H6EL65_9HELO|nr:putative het domain protein [Botrytis fragariae]KAF5875955.1 putative het domain protein [Botrytis fragariae]